MSSKPNRFSFVFIVFLSYISPQCLSFSNMYLDAHDVSLMDHYMRSNIDIDTIEVQDLVKAVEGNFTYDIKEKKNVIFIYAESLEDNFSNKEIFSEKLNHIDDIKASSVVFNNITQTAYTGWTIAGMVASLCGYPLQIPLESLSNNASLYRNFMPGVKCISDVLKDEGYALSFFGGAELNFAGKKAFLQTHGFNSLKGKQEFIKIFENNENNFNPWGLRDKALFKEAYKYVEDMSARSEKFGLFLLTVDTHAPGYPDPNCGEKYNAIKDNRFLDAVYCGSLIIKEFIEKVRESSFSDDVVIVVLSDHLAHYNSASHLLSQKERQLMFLINMPSGNGINVDKPGTHYDIGPTVLNQLGFINTINNGFGHNMLVSHGDKVKTRKGFLQHNGDTEYIQNIMHHTLVKQAVRWKWDNDLGKIDANGLPIDNMNYAAVTGEQ